MSCRFIANNGEESALYRRLNEAFGTAFIAHGVGESFQRNHTEADKIYGIVHTPAFKSWFGDFTKQDIDDKIIDHNNALRSVTTEHGEPRLFGNTESGGYYFENKDGYRRYITGVDAVLTVDQQEVMFNILLKYFTDLISDKSKGGNIISFLSESTNLSKFFEDDGTLEKVILKYAADKMMSEADLSNEQVDILEYVSTDAAAKFFGEKIRKFFKDQGIDIKDKPGVKFVPTESPEETEEGDDKMEESEIGSVVKTPSMDVSPLKTASRAVKAFLHFIPDLEYVNGEYRPKRDNLMGEERFVEYEKVHNTLLNIYGDINQGNLTFDQYVQEFIDRLTEFEQELTWAHYIKTELERMRDNKDNNSLKQFMLGLGQNHYKYVVGSFNNSEVKVFNANTTDSNIGRLMTIWNVAVVKNFDGSLVDSVTAMYDPQSIVDNAISELGKRKNKSKKNEITNEAIDQLATYMIAVFDTMGITVSRRTILKTFQDKEYTKGETGVVGANNVLGFFQVFIDDRKGAKKEDLFKENGKVNDFIKKNKFLKKMAGYQIFHEGSFIQESVIRPRGQSFAYSKPSYLKDRLLRLVEQKNGDDIITPLRRKAYHRTSMWLDYFQQEEEEERIVEANMMSHFKKERSGDRGADNKDIKIADELAMNMNGMLRAPASTAEDEFGKQKPIFRTLTAGDKSKAYQIEGFDVLQSDWENGRIGDNIVEQALKYVEDEYLRAVEVHNDMVAMEKGKSVEAILHYNTIQEHEKAKNAKSREKGVPTHKLIQPNGLKIYFLPELSYDYYLEALAKEPEQRSTKEREIIILDDIIKANNNGYGLYSSDGRPMLAGGLQHKGPIRTALKNFIEARLRDNTERAIDRMRKINAYPGNEQGNPKIDSKIRNYYFGNRKSKEDPKNTKIIEDAMYADYYLNQTFANVEYTKVFLGDPAYYKDEADFHKRVPATHIDGDKGIFDHGDEEFGVLITDKILEKASAEVIGEYSKVLGDNELSAYKKDINIADAQAWISLDRWVDIQRSLGRETEKHKPIFAKLKQMESDPTLELTDSEIKFILDTHPPQSVKGVYFNLDENGRPVYLKYSQSVLIPQLVRGSAVLEKMVELMNKEDGDGNKVGEIITHDGIKAGIPANKLNKDLSNADSVQPLKLKKSAWRLQQDLPTKGPKDIDVGSQIMKNILANINEKNNYGGLSGEQVIRQIFDTIDALSNEGLQELKSELYQDGNLNKNKVNKIILDNLKDPDDNLILALKRGVSYDALPQFRVQIMNALFAKVRKSIKPKTVGAGFIQVAPFGFDKFEGKSDVVWLKDEPGLKPPMASNGYKGDMLISGSILNKMIQKSYPGLTYRDFVEQKEDGSWDTSALFGPEGIFKNQDDLTAIGYRIPNQGLSSNDSLRIAGILPEIAGDIIVPYPEITTKTGSDYDIDKMYVMFKDFEVKSRKEARIKLLNKIGYGKNKKGIQTSPDKKTMREELMANRGAFQFTEAIFDNMNAPQLEDAWFEMKLPTDPLLKEYRGQLTPKDNHSNKLIDLYNRVLSSEHTHSQVISPLDADDLKKDINNKIKELVGEEEEGSLFDAVDNLELKHKLKGGKANVGITANHLVNVVYSQIGESHIAADLGVGHFDPEFGKFGGTRLFEFKTKGENAYITKEISSFLNAFVDIAKDPYIVEGNYTTKTSNVAFMLLRAGASKEWITRYFKQPIINDLLDEMERQDAKIVDAFIPEDKRPARMVLSRMMQRRVFDAKNRQDLNETQRKELVEKIEKENKTWENWFKAEDSGSNAITQLRQRGLNQKSVIENELKSSKFGNQVVLLKAFEEHTKLSKSLSNSVNATRSDVRGGGKDFSELLAMKNIIRKALDGKVTNVKRIFKQTQVGTFYKNGVEFTEELTSDLFAVTKFEPTINEIAYAMGRTTDTQLIQNIQNSLYTYYYNTGIFKEKSEDAAYQRGLFMGGNSVATAVLREQKKGSTNFLIKNLVPSFEQVKKVDDNGNPYTEEYGFITLPNSVKSGSQFRKHIYNAWLELLTSSNENDKNLAIRLIHHAFFTTGFQKKFGSIFEYAPHDYFFATGYIKAMELTFNDIDPSIPDVDAMEFVYRSNAFDDAFVPTLHRIAKRTQHNEKTVSRQQSALKQKFQQIPGINRSDAVQLKIDDVKKNGMIRPFIKYQEANRYFFYKYIGTVDGKAVYVKTTPYVKMVNLNEIMVFGNTFDSDRFVNDWEGDRKSDTAKKILAYLGNDNYTDILGVSEDGDRHIDLNLKALDLSYDPKAQDFSLPREDIEMDAEKVQISKMSWLKLENKAMFSRDGVNTMRPTSIKNVKGSRVDGDTENFGNPFTGSGINNAIPVGPHKLTYNQLKKEENSSKKQENIIEATEAYSNWLLSGTYPEDVNEIEKSILDKKRLWIIEQITNPESLLNDTLTKSPRLLYMDTKMQYTSHADALMEIIKNYHGDRVFAAEMEMQQQQLENSTSEKPVQLQNESDEDYQNRLRCLGLNS